MNNNPPAEAKTYNGFLDEISNGFNVGVKDLNTKLEDSLKALKERPSDPGLLAAYQSHLSEYTLYRSAQSNVVKVYKDVAASIITNFR